MRFQVLLIVALVAVVAAVVGTVVLTTSNPGERERTSGADDESVAGVKQTSQDVRHTAMEATEAPPTETVESPANDLLLTVNATPGSESRKMEAASDVVTAGTVSGVVTDANGVGLHGVLVNAEEYGQASTEADGRFLLANLPAQTIAVSVTHANYFPLRREGIAVGATNVELVLVRKGTLAVRVVDQFDSPIASANLRLQAREGLWIKNPTTDSEGYYVESAPPQGRILLRATMSGFTDNGEGNREVETSSGEVVVLRLHGRTFSIAGRVVIHGTNQPAAGFSLQAMVRNRDGGGSERVAQTDKRGEFEFMGLKRGAYRVSSCNPESAPTGWVMLPSQNAKTVHVYEKDVAGLTFEVIQGLQVRGTVLTKDNQPVSEAEVTVPDPGSTKVLTGQDGGFQTLAPPGVSLLASHETQGSGLSDPLSANPGDIVPDVRIVLHGPGSLFGTVTNRDGEAIDDCRVTLRDLRRGEALETTTTDEGIYSFDDVPVIPGDMTTKQGAYDLQVSKGGYSSVHRKVVLYPDEVVTVDLTLDRGGSITGIARDSGRRPLPDVLVEALSPGGERIPARSDAVGAFRLDSLPEGHYDVLFRLESNPPLAAAQYDIPVDGDPLDVTLKPSPWVVMGAVSNAATGEPISEFSIAVAGFPVDRGGRSFVVMRDFSARDGAYQLAISEPLEYRLRFIAEGFEPMLHSVAFQVEGGTPRQVNVELRPLTERNSIEGRFVPPDGTSLVRIDVLGITSFQTLGNEFHLDGLPVGSHDLLFYVQDDSMLYAAPIGVMPSVEVKANDKTNLGEFGVDRLTASIRRP